MRGCRTVRGGGAIARSESEQGIGERDDSANSEGPSDNSPGGIWRHTFPAPAKLGRVCLSAFIRGVGESAQSYQQVGIMGPTWLRHTGRARDDEPCLAR